MTVTVSIGNKTYDFNKCKEKTEKTELLPCSNHSNSERAVRIMEPMGNVSDNSKPTDRSQLKKFQRRPSMIQMIRKTIEDGEEEICYLDKYSRIVFPVSYTIFLGIYFGIYTVRWDNLVTGANGK